MEKVAIVILNYNGQKFLAQFLPDILKYTPGHPIYVADNASTDDSISFIKKNFPSVNIILLDKNYGFCGGYNRALQNLTESYYLLLNSDIEVTENWLNPLLDLLTSDESIAAVQPKILCFDNRDTFEYAGAAGGFIDKFGYPFCRGRIFNHVEKDEGQYDDLQEIFWATGACLLVRASLFCEFGGFDERFFAHMEEIDLCWRFKNAGFRVMYCPDSKVYHVGGGTLSKNNPKKVYYNFRNSLFVLAKNLPSKQLFYKILVRLLLDFPAAIQFLLKGSFKSFLMIIKAHFAFYKVLSYFLNQRSHSAIPLKDMNGYFPKSILFSFFIKGIRKFSRLN